MEAIRAEGLSRSFAGVAAVRDLSFAVAEGGIYGLVGPDGAGKTTTLRMLAGILRPDAGDATVGGADVVRDPEAVKNRIGYMSQRFGLYEDLTVDENIRFYADIHLVPRRARAERIDELLGFSNLTPFRRRLAGKLSGGMKQKLGLACALIHRPRILLLDEPTNGVDPVSRRDFWRILARLNRDGTSILLTTAYLDEAERCGRIGLLHRGRLLEEGTLDDLRKLVPGAMLEVRSDDPRRTARRLRARLPGRAVDVTGDRIHLVAASAADEAEIRAAAGAGAAAPRVERVAPSLEDVFVAVLGRREDRDGR